ncbi:Hypothetical protein CINCED_3A023511 [Cinara cedri]|uniref:SUMO-activating enzyme subunit n=1 Tax=Cinara cedri TaxID=506608 RepID=A0A5E4M0D3_9HEMI|nr:Hypothetical protein CINCED_3A023511 [Cinara cedri]
MAANIVGAFKPSMQNVVKTSKILLVGAGGIGCEVLKNLVLMGFGELEVIDLDTIEISNLNRQFLFSKDSVGKPKSHTAKESVLRFNPNVNINSHYGDIMDTKYGSAFFNKFKLVINALDNKRARSHVNRMCLSCDIPLIESGTMGYSGQVEFIKKDFSLCYECSPKPVPKDYPMCTIRNTPKEPIHCIIWAKFLFSQLFGENTEELVSMEETEDETEEKLSARDWAKANNYDGQKLFKKIFYDDIDYLLNMRDLYKSKSIKPRKLDYVYLNGVKSEYAHEEESKILTLPQYISMFIDSITSIKEKLDQSKKGYLNWDKDDDDFMNFVVASTNIRSVIFGIEIKSHFNIKSMAGNIIPAIPTANAIIGGQIVIHGLRVLEGKYPRCQTVYLRGMPNHKGEIIVKDKIVQKPSPTCTTCSTEGHIVLAVNTFTFTIRQFEDLVLRQRLNIVAPDVLIDGRMIISSDEDDELDLYSKTFSEANILHGSKISVDDFLQNYRVQMLVHHKMKVSDEQPEFELFNNSDDVDKEDDFEQEEYDDECHIDGEDHKFIYVKQEESSNEEMANESDEDNFSSVEEELEETELFVDAGAVNDASETCIKITNVCSITEDNTLSIIEEQSAEVPADSQDENNEDDAKDNFEIEDDAKDNFEIEDGAKDNFEIEDDAKGDFEIEDDGNETNLELKRKAEDNVDTTETKKSRSSTDE